MSPSPSPTTFQKRFANSAASAFDLASISAKLTIVSFASAYGPSVTVIFPPVAETCVPYGSRPPVASRTPALVISSMNRSISAYSSASGGGPPPFVVIKNRIALPPLAAVGQQQIVVGGRPSTGRVSRGAVNRRACRRGGAGGHRVIMRPSSTTQDHVKAAGLAVGRATDDGRVTAPALVGAGDPRLEEAVAAGGRVLVDVGSGDGRHTVRWAEREPDALVVGLDAETTRLDRALSTARRRRLRHLL